MPRVRGTINLAAMKRKHQKLLKDSDRAHTEALREAGEYAQEHVKTKSKFQRRSATNSVKDSTDFKIVKTASGKLVRIWNQKIVNGYNVSEGLEYGTRAHAIVARNARTLRFVSNGQVFFRRRVWHPGTKPYKFLFKAINAAHKFEFVRLQKKLEAIARKF